MPAEQSSKASSSKQLNQIGYSCYIDCEKLSDVNNSKLMIEIVFVTLQFDVLRELLSLHSDPNNETELNVWPYWHKPNQSATCRRDIYFSGHKETQEKKRIRDFKLLFGRRVNEMKFHLIETSTFNMLIRRHTNRFYFAHFCCFYHIDTVFFFVQVKVNIDFRVRLRQFFQRLAVCFELHRTRD